MAQKTSDRDRFEPQANQRRSTRLKEYDYHSPGAYFITICTRDRDCLFGKVIVGAGPCACPQMVLNDTGRMVSRIWQQIPEKYPGTHVDEFVTMPNHIHGLLIIDETTEAVQSRRMGGRPQGVAPTGLSLPDIVHRFKTMTTNLYAEGVKKQGWPPFRGRLWQRNYYEHVIRDDDEMNQVRQYVMSNPAAWALDRENPDQR